MKNTFIEISKETAKELYCHGIKIYITNDKRNHWKLPNSWEYGSSASAEQLFHRSIPMYEGVTKFYMDYTE